MISRRFLIATLLSTAIMLPMPYVRNAFDLVGMCDMMLTGTTVFTLVVIILPTIPYMHSYLADYRSNAVRYWSARVGLAQYGASKFAAAVIAGMASFISAMALLFAIKAVNTPLWLGTAPSDVGYATLVLDEAAGTGNPLAYIALSVLHHSLTAGMCAGVAFSAATVIPNIYAAMMAPVLMDIAYTRLDNLLPIPAHLNEIAMVQDVYNMGSISLTLLNKLMFTLCAWLIFGAISELMIRRRLTHE